MHASSGPGVPCRVTCTSSIAAIAFRGQQHHLDCLPKILGSCQTLLRDTLSKRLIACPYQPPLTHSPISLLLLLKQSPWQTEATPQGAEPSRSPSQGSRTTTTPLLLVDAQAETTRCTEQTAPKAPAPKQPRHREHEKSSRHTRRLRLQPTRPRPQPS